MARHNDILLYDPMGTPICDRTGNYNPHSMAAGLYFNPSAAGNVGRFRPWINRRFQETEEAINMEDRQRLGAMSQQIFASMAEIEAASKQKADLTIGLGMDAIWAGTESEWSIALLSWLTRVFYPNCTPYGIAYDWKTVWKTVSIMIDRDGDILMVLRSDRYGFPQIEFIHSHRIAQRFAQKEIKYGRFKGYEVRDGVVYGGNGVTPIGYNILGKTERDDYVIPADRAFLIYNPFCFDKGRGKPILSSALKDCYNLLDIDDYMSGGIKLLSSIFLVEKNKEGKAPQGRVGKWYGNNAVPVDDPNKLPVSEFTHGGTRYIKPEGEVSNMKSDSIGQTAIDYITRIEKRVMALLEFPHQWMLSPETMGGTMSRGIKETISRAVQARQALIEKYARIAIEYAASRAMQLGPTAGGLPEYYAEDIGDNLKFTKAAELILDPGYEHGADLSKVLNGLMSSEDFVRKWGKGSYKDTLTQRDKDVRKLLDTVEQFKKDYQQYANVAINLLGSKDAPQATSGNQE